MDLTIGYAAMLEQFHPTEIVELSAYAESLGFSGVMAADHFPPICHCHCWPCQVG